jgi:hypothetical protein
MHINNVKKSVSDTVPFDVESWQVKHDVLNLEIWLWIKNTVNTLWDIFALKLIFIITIIFEYTTYILKSFYTI